ncbi:MAG: InlB B-repeat-containing protein [Oscillospiraceae bacterium]|nr:InlB B-repeat-containing protein [Oscillospiraceae bacterium]
MSKTMKTLLGTLLCLCLMLGVMLCMGVSASAEDVPEVYYGTADNLTGSGTLTAAVDAAEADTAITYIKLNRDISLSESIFISSGAFTVDLNGYSITISASDPIRIYGSADVTFTDSSAEKTGGIKRTGGGGYSLFEISNGSLTLAGGSYSTDISAQQLVYIGGGTVTVRDGASFSSTNMSLASIYASGGELIIEGGSFSGSAVDVAVYSNVTIKGGSFASTWANLEYMGGTLDLSAMGSKANGLTLKANNTYSTEKITLPADTVIVNWNDEVVTTVDTSMNGFAIKAACEISFNANGGSGSMDSVSTLSGNYTLPECGFTAPEGKTFVGWSDSPDGEFLEFPGDSVAFAEDVTLYAIWADTVTISFNANGGTGTMDAVENLGSYTLPECGFTAPEGKTFVGWSDSADGEVKGQPGDSVIFTEDMTLYAVWEPDSVFVGGVELPGGMYLPAGSTVPTATKPQGGYAYYKGGVLTLNNYTYEGEGYLYYDDGEYYYAAAIYASKSLSVTLKGENSLTLTSENGDGISVEGNLTIDGTGSLNITSTANGIYVYAYDAKVVFGGSAKVTIACGNNEGVYIYGDDVELEIGDDFQLTIGTEDTPIREEGICVYGESTGFVTITDNAKVSIVTSDEEAIYAGYYEDYSSITISGNPTLNLIADEEALEAYDINIYGGTIYAESGEDYNAIDAESYIEINGGHITVKGDTGIYSAGVLIISGGYAKAEGHDNGLYAYDSLQIYGIGTEVIASSDVENGMDAIYSNGYLYVGDDIQILIPEDGYADNYRILDANYQMVSGVHLKDGGYHIYVGGVGMKPGDYLDNDGNISDTKPTEGGYAYYTYSHENGALLTLHDYDYYGDGYVEDWDASYGIGTELGSLTIVLEGYNDIYTDSSDSCGIWVDGDLTITGSGVLEVNADYIGIGTEADITIDGVCVEVNAYYYSLYYYTEDVTVKNGGLLYLYSDDECDLWIENLILDRGSLIIENSYLFVMDYDDYWGESIPGTITLNGTVLYDPYDGYIDEGYDYYNDPCTTVYDENGDYAYYITFYADGWVNYWGDWYYYDAENDEWLDGLVRVPYPPCDIDGVTYGPDQDTLDYYEGKGETFIDAEEGWFCFNEDGVFMSDYTGIDSVSGMYFENGFALWHPGFVMDEDDHYYYFIGDSEYGGNKLATGDVYVSKNTTDREFVIGGVYTFDEDGVLCEYDGITEMDDGTLRYYDEAQLMMGAGLIELDNGYIYVRSNGELAVNCEYWVSNNNGLDIPVGSYTFDENGYMVIPEGGFKNGVYFENGAWYYYENGKIAYNKGLISVNTIWHGEHGSENVYSGYIYVRSSGKLATGKYYITNVENDNSGLFITGQKVAFNDIGIAVAPKHGIVDVDGSLYFYQYNQIQYNAGLIEYNGGWIYVRSSGKLATGAYWITNTNGNLEAGMYEFGEDGYLVISDVEDGIVDENGVLYYYLDGKKLYGTGLRQLEDGTYIYVRTNGELATGSYWITNHNGLLPEDMYEFDADGILIEN